jgi:RHH-type rel operon transcriptional repressor/antitoxin RelB
MYSKEIDAMLAVRLDEETEGRLERLAARTGRTKTFYARAAIVTHLDDLEDFYLAEERLRDFRDGDAIPLSALKAELGLEN